MPISLKVFAAMFAGFNEPFAASGGGGLATGFERPSSHHQQVLRYVEDPWCGEPLSNGFVADMMRMNATWSGAMARHRSARTSCRSTVFGGTTAVGGTEADSVKELAALVEALGMADVTLRLYPDVCETSNETNRADVEAVRLASATGTSMADRVPVLVLPGFGAGDGSTVGGLLGHPTHR